MQYSGSLIGDAGVRDAGDWSPTTLTGNAQNKCQICVLRD